MATQAESLVVTLDANVGGYTAKIAQADAATEKLNTTTKKSGDSVGRFGRSSGMAGIQIQQFIGQVQGGQSAMLALSQQSADLGFVLGAPLLGAVVGISASIAGMLLPNLFSTSKALKEVTDTSGVLVKHYDKLDEATKKVARSALVEVIKAQKTQMKELQAELNSTQTAMLQANRTAIEGRWIERLLGKDPDKARSDLVAVQASMKALGLEIDENNKKLTELSTSESTTKIEELIKGTNELSVQFGMSAREIAIYSANQLNANQTQLDAINLAYDVIDAEKEKQRVLAEGNALANLGTTEADPELLNAGLLHEQRLRDEEAFIEAMAEIKFTGLENDEELFFKQQEMHQLLLDKKLISEEEFAKAQAEIAKRYAGAVKDEVKVVEQSEASKLNTKQNAIRAGMAANAMLFGDNKAIAAGLIVADTVVGIQRSLAINPYDYVNVGIIAATGAMGVASALGASKGGGSLPSTPSKGVSAPAQQDFQQETSSLSLTDASANGSQSINITVPDGDEIGQAIANWLSKANSEGRT